MLHADYRSKEEIEEEQEKSNIVIDNLGSTLHGKFIKWRDARVDKEMEWLSAIRAYNGIYESSAKPMSGSGGSDVFVHITRTKVQAAYSRIVDLMFQTSDKHWGIKPTPVPEGFEAFDRVTGEAVDEGVLMDQLLEVTKRMERQMEDQLVESDYEKCVKQAILEACILGSGAVKGVTVGVDAKERWAEKEGGEWGMDKEETPVPLVSGVSIFDIYPDPYATSVSDCEGIFERHVITRPQLRALAESSSFDPEAMAYIFSQYEGGNYSELSHEIERRTIAGYSTVSSGTQGRYEVLEYWGHVSGRDLEVCGCKVADPTGDYSAEVWICGGRTLKARLSPITPERIPYNIFPYERIPHQFWGTGVPEQMKDSQKTMNAAVIAMLDNLAISSGPFVEVNTDLLAPGEDATNLHPWRVFKREGGDPANPLLRFYQPRNVTANLANVVDMFRRFTDEETNMPSYTHGQSMPGLNKTASGMSMLMGAANVAVKGIIKNIDDCLVKPLIQSLYDWNMKWSDNDMIKGDMNIVARGSTALIAKELQSSRLIQFAQMTANPVDGQLTNRLAILRSIAESLDIDADKVIKTNDEIATPGQIGGQGNIGLDQQPGMGGIQAIPGEMP